MDFTFVPTRFPAEHLAGAVLNLVTPEHLHAF